MLLIPAIGLKEGKCVCAEDGGEITVYSDQPIELARRWVDAGARRLHIVNLDRAGVGSTENIDAIYDIVEAFPDLSIQVGGGIRDESIVDIYVQAGVRYVVIGTQAVKEPHLISDLCALFPTHIIVGLDVRGGKVATDGWSKLSKHDALDMAQHFEEDGVETIIYTEFADDGSMLAVNIKTTVQLAEALNIPVIAAGGIKNIENVKKLAEVSGSGIIGAITSRAIYEGTMDFAEAQKAADAVSGPGAFGL